jgi:4-hydroxybenzoate polyprenyltransferase
MLKLWLKAIRWKNLLIALGILFAFRFGIHFPFGFPSFLPFWAFLLAGLSLILAMAYGYLINDIRDLKADEVNRPDRQTFFQLYAVEDVKKMANALAVLSFLIGAFLAFYIERPTYMALPGLTILLLHQYAHNFKGRALIGNVIISFLAALMVISLLAFDVLPAFDADENVRNYYKGLIYIYISFAVFAFHITLIREIVKDLEDIRGDQMAGYRTLPIVIGERPTRLIAFLLALIFSVTGFRFSVAVFLENSNSYLVYGIISLFSLIILYLLRPGERTVNYRQVQTLLKVLMLFGVVSLVLLSFIP